MEHYTLKNFALHRFGKYISEVLEKLILLSKEYPEYELENKYLKQICSYLEEHVHKYIPQTLASELSDVMVRMISSELEKQWKFEFENIWTFKWDRNKHNSCYCAESFDRYSDFVDRSTSLAVQVSCAASHKYVTTFRYDHSSDLHFQQKYLRQILLRSVELHYTEIILDKMPMTSALPHLPMLEYWTSEKARFDIVKNLSEGSNRIKILNMQLTELLDFQTNDDLDFILKFQNLSHLNTTGIGFSTIEAREKLFQGLSSSENSSTPRTELKSLALFLQQEDSNFISQYLPNITSLELLLFHEFFILPLKDLKHLTSLALTTTPSCPVDFRFSEDLIREIGPQLTVLKLNLTAVNFNFIATHCTNLKSFVYCLETHKEYLASRALFSGTISNYFSSKITIVENLELRLFGEYIWKYFPYLLNCFPNVKRLKLSSLQKVEDKNVSLEQSLLLPLRLGQFEEFIFNNKKVEICGKHVFVTSNIGYVTYVTVEDLEEIIDEIRLCKEIPDMGRKYNVIPRQKFIFPAKMMQP